MRMRVHFAVVALAVALHVVVVASVARQPLNVTSAAPGDRALIWPLHADTTHRLGPAADFFAVYDAGGEAPTPRGIYEDIGVPAHAPTIAPYGYPFRYLPIVALTLGAALRSMPPHVAYIAWIGITELVLGVALFALRRAASEPRARTFATCALLVSSPYFLELHMGQFTFVSNALVLGGVALFASESTPRRRIAGAFAFLAACLLKLVPIVTAPAVVRERRGFALVILTATAIAATSAPYFIAHPGAWEAFIAVNTGGHMDGLNAGNHGLLYLVNRTFELVGRPLSRVVWTTLATLWQLVLLGSVGGAVLVARRTPGVVGACAMTIAFVLCYVHVWEHHYSATLLAGVVVLIAATNEDGGWSRRSKVAAIAIALLAAPTPFVLLDPHPDPSVWDPSLAWGALALVPPLFKVAPSMALLCVALTFVARDGFSFLTLRLRRTPDGAARL